MIRLLAHTPELLEPRDIVVFRGNSEDFSKSAFEPDKYYEVKACKETVVYRSFILPPGGMKLLDLANNEDTTNYLNLYPTLNYRIYEMLVGMESSSSQVLMYIQFPYGRYTFTLESPNLKTNPENELGRYVAPITDKDTPKDKPRLRVTTIKGADDIYFQLVNASMQDEKIVFRFHINICELEEISGKPEHVNRVIEGKSVLEGI